VLATVSSVPANAAPAFAWKSSTPTNAAPYCARAAGFGRYSRRAARARTPRFRVCGGLRLTHARHACARGAPAPWKGACLHRFECWAVA